MEPHDLLLDIHALEEDLLSFERKYGVRSDLFYAAYAQGEEPEDDAWMLDFKTWLSRLAEYRNAVQRRGSRVPTLRGLIQVAA
jgi:hypothetical protein